MLTEPQKFANKARFIEILAKLGFDITNIVRDLEAALYFDKPLTLNSGRSYSGGLCEDAILHFDELVRFADTYCPGRYSEAELAIVSLFRNVYRAWLFIPCVKNVKNDLTGTWETVAGFKVDDSPTRITFGDNSFSSMIIASNYVNLSNEIKMAIQYGDPRSNFTDMSEILRRYPLVALTRLADAAVSYLVTTNKYIEETPQN